MRRASIVRDFGAEMLRIGSMLALGLVLTPILLRDLGESGFGLWKFIQSVMFYVLVCEPALRGAMARFLAAAIGRDDRSDASRVVATGTAILVPIVGVFALAAVIAAPAIVGSTISSTDPLYQEGVTTLRVVSVGALITTGAGVLGAILHAMKRVDLANVVLIPGQWLKLLVFILILFNGGGIVELAWATLGLASVTLVLTGVLVTWTIKGRRLLSRKDLAIARIPGFGRFVVYSGLAKSGDVLRVQTTMILISMASLKAAAIYGLVETIAKIGGMAIVGFADTASPRLAMVSSRPNELRPMISALGAVLGLLNATVALGLILLGTQFIRLWAAPEDTMGLLEDLVLLMGVVTMISAGRMMIGRSLRAQNRVEYIAYGQIIEGVSCVILAIVLFTYMGVLGPIVARIVVTGVYLLLAAPWFMRRVALIGVRAYYWGCYARPLLAAAIGAIPLAVVVSLIAVDTWLLFVFLGLPGMAMIIATAFFLGLGSEHRAEVMLRARQVRGV